MYKKIIYIIIVVALSISLIAAFVKKQFGIDLGVMDWIAHWVSSPIALLLGIVFALSFGATFEKFTKTMSKKMLQNSVIGLGFGMTMKEFDYYKLRVTRLHTLDLVTEDCKLKEWELQNPKKWL